MFLREIKTSKGIYRSSCYQGTLKRWYGFIPSGYTEMMFIAKKEYEEGIKENKQQQNSEPPPLLPFPF